MQRIVKNAYILSCLIMFANALRYCWVDGFFSWTKLIWTVLGIAILGGAATAFFLGTIRALSWAVNLVRVPFGYPPVDWLDQPDEPTP